MLGEIKCACFTLCVHVLRLFFFNIYFYFLAASGLSCGTQDLSLQCTGCSLVVVRGLLSSCGSPAPEPVGSVVVAHGLSCPVALTSEV